MYIQSYETSGTGVYSHRYGHLITLLRARADFSITDFSSQLPQLLSATLGIACGRTFYSSVYIVKEEYDYLFKQFRDLLRSENDALVESRAMRNSRLLFKRPLLPPSGSDSQRYEHFFHPSLCCVMKTLWGYNSYKRARTAQTLSPSSSFVEEPPSPSSRSSSVTPSFAASKSLVTLDMLRDLTKSVMKSYQT